MREPARDADVRDLISIGELAQLGRISESSARRLLDKGRIPSQRLGMKGLRFCREADARQYLAALRNKLLVRIRAHARERGVPRARLPRR